MITSKFRQVEVIYYSFDEWKELEAWTEEEALGYYSPEDNKIHILNDYKDLKEYVENKSDYKYPFDELIEDILIHEYTHLLQSKKGKGEGPMCILPPGVVEVKDDFKYLYDSYYWETEAEARWIESHPELLDYLEELVETYLSE